MARILVVDDEEDILFLLEQTFAKAGHVVVSALDPQRAVHMARSGRFDAIVLDVMMPELSGWDLLGKLRREEETESTPVVLLSALSSVSDRVRGLRSGADDYLTKPFEPDELVARVEILIQRNGHLTAALQGQLGVQSLHEVLQQLEQSKKSGRLELVSRDGNGEIFLDGGRIRQATHDRLQGEEAVLSLLDLTSGRFRFHPDERVDDGAELSLNLQPLLIRSAWIDDELAKRQDFLPDATEALRWSGSAPPQPENIPTLPIEIVRAPLSSSQGSTLEELVNGCRVAARRVRLAVAWLREQGFLQLAEKTVELEGVTPAVAEAEPPQVPPHLTDDDSTLAQSESSPETKNWPENADMAIREVLQSAIYRGLTALPVKLHVFADSPSWKRSLRPLAAVPKHLAEAVLSSTEDTFGCRLHHPSGDIHMQWTLLSGKPPDFVPPSPESTGVVLWLDSSWSALDLSVLGHQLIARAPNAGLVLVTTHRPLSDFARERFGHDARWRVLDRVPTLHRLFFELAQTDPRSEADDDVA